MEVLCSFIILGGGHQLAHFIFEASSEYLMANHLS